MATAQMEKMETTTVAPERTHGGATYAPSVDILEMDDKFVLYADLPGATAESIDINYERGLLTLHARVANRQNADQTHWLLRDYGIGDFYRSFQIGEGIDASRIQADVANGVLTLQLPKADALKARKIAVQTR